MTHIQKCCYMWGNVNNWCYNVRQFTKQTCMRYVFQMGEKETKFMHILNHKIQRRRDYSIIYIYRLLQFRHEQAPKSSILDHDIIENKIKSLGGLSSLEFEYACVTSRAYEHRFKRKKNTPRK